MANLLCARFTRFLHLNPNHKSRFDNPIKHDLLEKDKTTLLFDTIIFPNNCLFTQKVVYQRCEFATQREFQLVFKSQYTCRFFCTETSQHEASRSFTKAIQKFSVNSLNNPIGIFWDLFTDQIFCILAVLDLLKCFILSKVYIHWYMYLKTPLQLET